MKKRRLKINFWGKYEEELIVSVKENNKNRIRELFALSYLDYLDVILTPIENFRLKQVYNKRVIEEMYCGGWSGWDNTDESRDYINKMLTWLNDN